MAQRNLLLCVAAWVVLVWGRLVGMCVVEQQDTLRNVKGWSMDGVSSRSHLPSESRLQDAAPLEPTELLVLNTSNASYVSSGLSSRPSRLKEVLNASDFNTSSFYKYAPSSPHIPPILHTVTKKNHSTTIILPNWERAPTFLATRGNFSKVYRLPSWETSLSLFGVQSNNEVRLSLLHAHKDEAPVNITLYGRDDDSEIQFNMSRQSHVVVSPYHMMLNFESYTWFIIFRKGHVVYVYLADKYEPFLVYEHFNMELDLFRYTRFQVWSKAKAHWNFVGKDYRNKYKYMSFSEKALTVELDGIREGLTERLEFLTDLVSLLERPHVVSNLKLSDIQEIKDIVESVVPLRNILYFYSYTNDKQKKIIGH